MASDESNVKGEGFEILGHKPPEQKEAKRVPAEETPAAETPGVDAEAAAAQYEIDVYKVLQLFVRELGEIAWQKMGLQANPFTNRIEKDIEQARLAIDSCADLAEKLLPHLQGEEARAVQVLLTDLRLNFVRQSGERP